jgi:hypothetical protein
MTDYEVILSDKSFLPGGVLHLDGFRLFFLRRGSEGQVPAIEMFLRLLDGDGRAGVSAVMPDQIF